MMLWETWKKGFDAWEGATARYLEQALRSPLVLWPSGTLLGASMKAKAASDRMLTQWWGAVGLPTKRDQERTLYALQELQGRLHDLEEKLEDGATGR